MQTYQKTILFFIMLIAFLSFINYGRIDNKGLIIIAVLSLTLIVMTILERINILCPNCITINTIEEKGREWVEALPNGTHIYKVKFECSNCKYKFSRLERVKS